MLPSKTVFHSVRNKHETKPFPTVNFNFAEAIFLANKTVTENPSQLQSASESLTQRHQHKNQKPK